MATEASGFTLSLGLAPARLAPARFALGLALGFTFGLALGLTLGLALGVSLGLFLGAS